MGHGRPGLDLPTMHSLPRESLCDSSLPACGRCRFSLSYCGSSCGSDCDSICEVFSCGMKPASSFPRIPCMTSSLLRRRRSRMRRGAALSHPQCPADRFEVHLADIWILPRLFGVSQSGVEDTAFAIHLAPRDGKIMVGAMNARIVRIIQLRRIEAQQYIYLVPRPRLRLVDFIVLHECLGEVAHRWKVRGLVDNRRIEGHPGMLINPPADYLAVFRPGVIRIQSRMNPHKALAVVMNEGQHVCFLAGVHIQFAGRAGKNQKVEIAQIFCVSAQVLLGKQLRIGAHLRIPQAALLAHVVDGSHSRRNRIMLEALGLADHQHMLEMDLLAMRRRWRPFIPNGLSL